MTEPTPPADWYSHAVASVTKSASFQWPLPNGLTDTEVKQVYVGLVAGAAALKEMIVDRPSDYLAALAAASAEFIHEELSRRGVQDDTFGGIRPEDFKDAGSAGNGSV